MNAKRMMRGVVGTIIVLFLTAQATTPCLGASSSDLVLESRSSRGLVGTLTLQQEPLLTMTNVPMHLNLTDAAGAEVNDAKVDCALTMPAMPMPDNLPRMKSSSGGYAGNAVFTMAGAWLATFSLKLPSGETDEITFDIPQVLLK